MRRGGDLIHDSLLVRDSPEVVEVSAALMQQARDEFEIYRFTMRTQWGIDPITISNHPPSTLWDADHKLAVEEGGGCCGLDGYETLCKPCHKAKTAEHSARRADRKRRFTEPQGLLFDPRGEP